MKYLIILTILLSSCKYEYHIILNKDYSTSIYNRKHKLVGILPFDSVAQFDKLMLKDNL